jgi:hypothetical protein
MLHRGGPVPRQKFVEPVHGMIVDAAEHIGEPSLGIKVVELGRLCRAPNYAERACFPQDSR